VRNFNLRTLRVVYWVDVSGSSDAKNGVIFSPCSRRLSCNWTALKRCNKTESLWNKSVPLCHRRKSECVENILLMWDTPGWRRLETQWQLTKKIEFASAYVASLGAMQALMVTYHYLRQGRYVCHVTLSVCRITAKVNQPISLILNVMIGPTSRKNKMGDFNKFISSLAFLEQSATDFRDTAKWLTPTRNPQHFWSDPADIWISLEIRIQIPDHFG